MDIEKLCIAHMLFSEDKKESGGGILSQLFGGFIVSGIIGYVVEKISFGFIEVETTVTVLMVIVLLYLSRKIWFFLFKVAKYCFKIVAYICFYSFILVSMLFSKKDKTNNGIEN